MRKLLGVSNLNIKFKILDGKKPKELKGVKAFDKVKVREKNISVYMDESKDLYYYDNSVYIGAKSEIVDNKVNIIQYKTKLWFKIEGIYEHKDEFILNILNKINELSEEIYIDNTVADNIALSDIYEEILRKYLEKVCN